MALSICKSLITQVVTAPLMSVTSAFLMSHFDETQIFSAAAKLLSSFGVNFITSHVLCGINAEYMGCDEVDAEGGQQFRRGAENLGFIEMAHQEGGGDGHQRRGDNLCDQGFTDRQSHFG
eukprot:TRINITY_DN36497_c0_g1_i1.p2 TRINITY_DN36497_c0_g1~~TRINITY_DN36497_c0_g1_i1.p2  ORF type:complete len:120 (-),score=10.82 TRINITY_DN36497_c0_g1_i1:326-685(-)